MNKIRKISLIFSVLSLISSMSIIGVGFSIWVFDEGEKTIESNVVVNVSDAYSFGTVNVYAPNTYYLEPPSDKLATYGGLVFYTRDSDHVNEGHELDYTLVSSVALAIKSNSSIQETLDPAIIDDIVKNLKCTLSISFTEDSALKTYFNIKETTHEFSFSYYSGDRYPEIDFVSKDAFNLNGNFEYNQDALASIDINKNGFIDPNEWKNIQTNKGSVILDFEFSGL